MSIQIRNSETKMLFFRGEKFTDTEIIEGLQLGGDREDAILKYLYSNYYPRIKKFILSKGGNNVEVKDIFQDSVIVFYQNVKANKFKLDAKISTYLFTLAKNMWINRQKKLSKIGSLDSLYSDIKAKNSQPIDFLLDNEKNEFVLELLGLLSDDCRKILTLSIYQRLPMKRICEIMGYQNEQVARNKKSKCLKYLKQAIQKSTNFTNTYKELK